MKRVAVQTCFVVEDVKAAVETCEDRYGWGPFLCFSAPTPEAGPDAGTDVALGAAGRIQVELVKTRNMPNAMGAYQKRYGHGFQHIGVFCEDIDENARALSALGGSVRERGSHPGVRFAFIDTPAGPGLLELLQPGEDVPTPPKDRGPLRTPLKVESATLVTRDIAATLAFFEGAFGWDSRPICDDALEIDGAEAGSFKRASGRSGALRVELLEPVAGENLYSRHLAERDHGLVHVSALDAGADARLDAACTGRWRSEASAFRFVSGPLGEHGLRLDGAA